MRIGIDGRMLTNPYRAGVGNWLGLLLDGFKALNVKHQVYLFYFNNYTIDPPADNYHNVIFAVPPIKIAGFNLYSLIWKQLILPILLYRNKIDVFLDHTGELPVIMPCKSIAVVHDVIPLLNVNADYPEPVVESDVIPLPNISVDRNLKNKLKKTYTRLILYRGLSRANKIIAISNSTKNDLCNLMPNISSKINVVHNGLDPFFSWPVPNEVIEFVKKNFTSGQPYILAVSTIKPRKNFSGIINAFAIFKKTAKLSHRLLLIGESLINSDSLLSGVETNIIKDITFTGYVSKDQLKALYTMADFFVMPSFYEGFGYPVIEAMACGCPVISSKTSSLPEVGGSAVFYVNPYSIEDIAEAMIKMATDSILRQRLVEKGKKQIQKFDYLVTAKKVLEVIEDAIKTDL